MATLRTKPENINTNTRKKISRRERKVAMSQFGSARTMAHGNCPWTWQSRTSELHARAVWNPAHPINYTLSGARNGLVPFLQNFVENRQVPYWMLPLLRP